MVKCLKKIMAHLYDWLEDRHRIPITKQVQVDLVRLNPSVDKQQLYRNYFTNKMVRSFLIGVVVVALGIALKIQASLNCSLGEVPGIERNNYSGGDKQVELIARIGDIEERLTVRVNPEQLTDEEAQLLYEEFIQELPAMIIGENSSLQEVTQDLILEENYEGYPFILEWSSDRGEILTRKGVVHPCEDAVQVNLSVTVTYGELLWNELIDVTVVSPEKTEEEKHYEELTNMMELSEKMAQQEAVWKLPMNWKGQDINWKLQVEDYSSLVLMLGGVVALMIFFCNDLDLHKEVETRCVQMRRDYPDIVYKVLLYMGAGMTMRGAFRRITEEYEEKRECASRAAYEEILYTVHELESGVSESVAYVNLGKRTGLQEYIRLGTLLTQNLKRGNATLLLRLREEVDRVSVERMQNCKRQAEEAVTKLLVPMVIMLAVVMVMIMMPAFTSIN